MRSSNIESSPSKSNGILRSIDRYGCRTMAPCFFAVFLLLLHVMLPGLTLHLLRDPRSPGDWETAVELMSRFHTQQLAATYRTLLERHDGSEETLYLDPSFFSRPPDILTYPTTVTTNTTYPEAPTTCKLITKPIHRWSFARIVVFQKNGNKHLQTLLLHYLHVLPPDALAIIDHGSTDAKTLNLLKTYGDMGVHVWHCTGIFKWKSLMWSMVTRVYAENSEFVIPVDGDELVAVTGDPYGDADVPFSWDSNSFYRALTSMNNTGQPYKMEHVIPLPSDCHFISLGNDTNSQFYPSPACNLRHAIRRPPQARFDCMDKTFTHGLDFVQTDTGNHFAVTKWTTKKYSEHRTIKRMSQFNVIGLCHEMGVDAWFIKSPLGLMHTATMEFTDWLVHGFRGASLRNFTRGVNCSETKGGSSHYCKMWHQIEGTGMHMDRLLDLYRSGNCPPLEAPVIKPLGNFFSHACGKTH